MTDRTRLRTIFVVVLVMGVAVPTLIGGVAAASSSYQVHPNVTYSSNGNASSLNVTIGDNVRISNSNTFIGPNSMRFDMSSVGYQYRVSSTRYTHVYVASINPKFIVSRISYPSYVNPAVNTTTTVGLVNSHTFTLSGGVNYFNQSSTITGGDGKQDFAYTTSTSNSVTMNATGFIAGTKVVAYDNSGTVLDNSTVSSTGILHLTLPSSDPSVTHVYLASASGSSSGSISPGSGGLFGGIIGYALNNIYVILIVLAILGGVLFFVNRGGNGGNGKGGSPKTSTIKPYSKR